MFGHVYGMIDALPAIFDKKDSQEMAAGKNLFNEVKRKKISEK